MKLFLKIIVSLVIFTAHLSGQPENPGPLKAGWTSVSLQREGRTLNCRVYYPAITEGSEAPIDSINGPYAVIAFGHGFFMQTSYYLSLFSHLASYGYVVIAPQFPDTQHELLAYDLLYCLQYLKTLNAVPGSRYYGLIDTLSAGVSGHSMGGGASLIAAVIDSTIKVTAPLAAAETTPSVISRMDRIKAAVYLISAQNDGITPVSTVQSVMYQNAAPVKSLPVIKGGNHTKFMDVSLFDWTDPNGYSTRANQLRLTRRYLTSVFNLYLKNDTSYFKYAFGADAATDTAILFQEALKPHMPFGFSLKEITDTLYSNQALLSWRGTYSLNLEDTVLYSVQVSEDSLFELIEYQSSALTDTMVMVSVNSGAYYWRVRAFTSDSTYRYSNNKGRLIIAEPASARETEREEAGIGLYPNPAGEDVNIQIRLDETGEVMLSVYDVSGSEVLTPVKKAFSEGVHSVKTDLGGLARGVYFLKVQTNKKVFYKKLIRI
ncbi:MAG: T9SS type A sorting domain-containing protein [Ignavibacteriaceae bacterium]|nr:T9SS type A sorting domain-containing protein [Ignavibacteriaceae bacterium]